MHILINLPSINIAQKSKLVLYQKYKIYRRYIMAKRVKTANPDDIKNKLKWAQDTQNLTQEKDLPQGFYREIGKR